MAQNLSGERPRSREMAIDRYEGTWAKARRVLSKATHTGKVAAGAIGRGTGSALKGVGSLGQAVIETKAGKIAAALALGLAASQIPVDKSNVGQKVLEGTQGLANTASEAFDDWMFGPKFKNNPVALNDAKVIRHEISPREGKQHFAHNMIVTSEDPTKTRVNVLPINANVADGVIVLPIGSIPVGITLEKPLMTDGIKHYFGVNDFSKSETDRVNTGYDTTETYAAINCDVLASVILDPNGNPMPDIAQDYPVCYIEGSNIKRAK